MKVLLLSNIDGREKPLHLRKQLVYAMHNENLITKWKRTLLFLKSILGKKNFYFNFRGF